jgi:hypothetical protein
MTNDQPETAGRGVEGPALDPRQLLLIGLGATGAGWVLSWSWLSQPLPGLGPVRALLVLAGLLSAGGAVSLRPHAWRFLVGGAAVAALAFLATDEDWDTVRLVLGLLVALALLGALLVALSPPRRRTALSVLILFHLGALLVAVTVPEPPNADTPYLPSQLWENVYHSYLDFLHLNAAYNYYSPNPASEELVLWIHIRYADDKARWVKIPDREKTWTDLEYTRWATLAENIAGGSSTPDDLDELTDQRWDAAEEEDGIPPLEDEPSSQYEEPTKRVKLLLASVARFVARTYPHPTDPGQAVTGIKFYRVSHLNLSLDQLREGVPPTDPTLYQPYYFGEYTADGRLKESSYYAEYDEDGEVVYEERDPYLYWLIPIIREDDGTVTNYVKIHAGGDDAEDEPW